MECKAKATGTSGIREVERVDTHIHSVSCFCHSLERLTGSAELMNESTQLVTSTEFQLRKASHDTQRRMYGGMVDAVWLSRGH